MKCIYCGKPTEKAYIIADDLENPRPMCKKCIDDFQWECMLELGRLKEEK